MTTADEEWRTKYNFSGNGNASGNGQAPPPGAERTEWEALDLLAHKFPEMVWAVMDLLPAGLAILSGPPKQGKSWLALRLAVCVATGTAFLGHKVGAGRVLYAALEDGARRAKTRLKKMPEHAALAKGLLTIWTVAPRVDEGLLARLETWATAGDGQPPPRLIVLDVFQRVRASKGSRLI